MAGIFSDVSTDIQKLRQLKAEIENVKKSLKGIDVNVNIDIAKGMEAQLQSLMKQYDALVKKVSEAEGKIMISTKRINDASEKIIKAQEQLSKAAGMNTQPSNGNADVSLNNVGTASVRAQAKAYDELAEEIDSVMGTRSQNIKRMIDEQNAIRLINEEIKRLTKLQIGNSTLTNTQQKRLEQLNNSLLTHKAALSDVRQTLMNNVKLDNAAITSMNGLSQSLSRMRVAYRELTEEERNSPFGKELLASIQQADAKIKELDATIGNHQRNVGNYAKGYNGLNMSVQQIVRELPSAAMGLNMFFLAISNNLPILTDEIKRAKAANEELKVSGQKGIPVWKQVVSSLFSWQSALMVGITLLTVHGDKVWEWVKTITEGKDAALSLDDAQKKVNEAFEKDSGNVSEQTVRIRNLSEQWKKLGDNLEDKKRFIKENKEELDKLGVSVSNVNDAENLLAKNTEQYIQAMSLRAQAASAFKLATEAAETAIKKQVQINQEEKKSPSFMDRFLSVFSATGASTTVTSRSTQEASAEERQQSRIEGMKEEKKAAEETEKAYTELFTTLSNQAKKVLNDAGISESDNKEETKNAKTDYASQLADARVKAQQTTEKLRLQIMLEGIAKRKALAKQEYDDSIADIDKQERDTLAKMDKARKQGDNIPQSQYDSVKQEAQTQRILAQQVYNEQIFQIEKEYQDKSSQSLIDYYKEYGTYQEKKLAIAQDYARKIAAAETEGEVKTLTRQRDDKLASLDFEEMKKGMDWEKIFGDLDKVSTDTLERLREKLKQYLEGIGDDISPESFKEVMDAFNNLDVELADRSPFETLKSGYKGYETAMQEVIAAQNLLKQAQMAGTVIVEEYNEETGELTRELITQAEAEERLRNAQDKRYNAQKTLTQAVNSIGQKGEAVVNAGNDIVDMLTSLGVEVPEALQGVLGGLGTITSSLASIDFTKPFSVLTGITGTLKGIGQTIGGIMGFGGADYSEYENMKAQYDTLISVWDTLIGKKIEYIDIDYGAEAQKAADEAIRLTETQIERQRQLANMLAGSGASVGSHSLGYRVNDRMSSQDWRRLSGLVGQQVGSLGDVLSLDADVIGKVLQDEKFVSVLTEVNSEFIDYISNIGEYAEQLEEIAEKEKEALTGVGLDDFRNGYTDLLADLDSDNQDFADDFEKYLQNAIFSSLVANKYKERIEKLYNQWADYTDSGGKLTGDEADRLRNEYQNIVDDMLAEREQIMKEFGWTSSSSSGQQSASSRGFGTEMTHEDAGELSGRFTAVYESNLRIETAEQQQTVAITELRGSISALASKETDLYNIADETRTILADSYLELQKIRENTGEIIKPIKQIQRDIAEVKKNTLRT